MCRNGIHFLCDGYHCLALIYTLVEFLSSYFLLLEYYSYWKVKSANIEWIKMMQKLVEERRGGGEFKGERSKGTVVVFLEL